MRPALVALAILVAGPAQGCDLALVLANDASSSITHTQYATMHDGIAAALTDELVLDGLAGRSAYIASFEFSDRQSDVFGWTLATPDGLAQMASATRGHKRAPHDGSGTGTGEALAHALSLFARLPEPCDRWVIDLVTDGEQNSGRHFSTIYADFSPEIQVNLLVVAASFPGNLEAMLYGFGAFMVGATSFDDFAAAFRKKLMAELF